MLLSIGIMMKNEEEHIEKCLKALMPILDNIQSEIVVVDTGSNDRSIEIAKKYTKKVYSYKWNNDFSEMRNKIISHCEGQWYLSVDADEILENADNIINFFVLEEYKEYNAATVKIKSFHDSQKESSNTANLTRLFKKDRDFKFVNSIHEQPIFKFPIKSLNAIFNHYGYISDDDELMRRKFERNKKLLEKEIEKNPKNCYMKFQLAITYSMHNQNDKALKILDDTYSKMNDSEKNTYKQIGMIYSNLLLEYNRIYESKQICEYYLLFSRNDEQYKIDFSYNLGQIEFIERNYEKAIEHYKLYLDLVAKYENNELPIDFTTAPYRCNYKEVAYLRLTQSSVFVQKYEDAIEYALNLEKEINIISAMSDIIKSYIMLENYEGLNKYYLKKIKKSCRKAELIFAQELEKQKKDMDDNQKKSIRNLFIKNEDIYASFNKFINDNNKDELKKIITLIKEDNYEQYNLSFLGEILYISLKKKYDIANMFSVISYKNIIEFIEYCNKTYEDKFLDLINIYVKSDKLDEFNNIKIKQLFCKSLLILDENKVYEHRKIFKEYIECGIKYIKFVYSNYVLENELINELKNEEEQFLLYMLKGENCKNTDTKEYLKYLKKALKVYPVMKDSIRDILDELNNKFNKHKNEIDLLGDKLIDNIRVLIGYGKIEEAKNILNQFNMIVGKDKRLKDLEYKLYNIKE